MYRTLFGIFGTIAFALLLVGLSFSSSQSGRPDFRFVNGTEPSTLDPHLLTGAPGGRLALAIFEGLTRTDAKTLQPVPGVAERWDISDDQTRYTFHLRKDAKWTDGTPITAKDFVYSFTRALNPKTGSEYAYILYMIRHAEAFNTFGGRSEALQAKLPAELEKLAQAPTDGPGWQSFLSEHHVHDVAKGAKAPIIGQLLDLKQRGPSAQELSELSSALKVFGTQLGQGHQHAVEHFGKDEGVFALSDHQLVVELEAPTAYFLEVMAFYTALPVPQHVVEQPGNAQNWFVPEKIVSNGPFRIESWTVNDRMRLVKNEHYWGKDRVQLESLEALALENVTTALNLYLTGEVDWLPDYPRDLVDELKQRPDFYSSAGWVTYYYRFNNQRKPFTDKRVRQAFALAIDRQLLVDRVLRLGETPASYFVPPGVPGYERPPTQLEYNVPKAKQLLAEAGYPDGKGLKEIGILYNTSESHKKIAEFVADQLRRNLGVQVKAYNQEWQSYLQTARTLDYDIARAGWIGDYIDPNTFLDMWVTNGGNNQTGFSSAKYDRLIAASANIVKALDDRSALEESVVDKEKLASHLAAVDAASGAERVAASSKLRLFLLSEAERILVDDEFPIMPIYFYVVSGMVQKNIGGFYATLEQADGSTSGNVTDRHPLDALFLKEPR